MLRGGHTVDRFRSLRNSIGRWLAWRGWSDRDLAMRAGLSRAHVNRIKNGRARPTTRDALLISSALEAPIEEVFHLPDDD